MRPLDRDQPGWSRRLLLATALTAFARPALAQPAGQPLRLVVPFAPGGSTDVAARILAPALGEVLRRSVVVENRGGGGGLIGAEAVAGAPPDGLTMAFFTVSAAVLNALLNSNLRLDLRRAFAPVSLVGTMPMLLVTGPQVPARNLGELLALLRREPGRRSYGSAGPGSINHLSGHLLAMRAGAEAVHVPYRGAGLVIPDLISGNVDFLIEGIASLHPHVTAGALRGLAVTSATRSALLPDVPTAMEAGLPDFEILNWFGTYLPAATPAPVVEALSAGIAAAVRLPEVAARLRQNGIEPVGSTPAELERFWDGQFALWRPVVQASGARTE